MTNDGGICLPHWFLTRDGRGRRDPVAHRGMQRAGQGPDRPGPAPGPHLDRVPPPRRGLPVRPPAFAATRTALLRAPADRPAGPAAEGAHRGKRPPADPGSAATTDHDLWRQLTTVADVVTLLAAWLQPVRDRLAVIRWTLWKQTHRLRAQISHYQRRGERPPLIPGSPLSQRDPTDRSCSTGRKVSGLLSALQTITCGSLFVLITTRWLSVVPRKLVSGSVP